MRVLLPLRPANSDTSEDDSSLGDSSCNSSGSDESGASLASEKSAPAVLERNSSEGGRPSFFIAGSDEEEEQERLTKSVSLSYIPSIALEDEADNNRDEQQISSSGAGVNTRARSDLNGTLVRIKQLSRSQSTPRLGDVGLSIDQDEFSGDEGSSGNRAVFRKANSTSDSKPSLAIKERKPNRNSSPAVGLTSRPSSANLSADAGSPPSAPILPPLAADKKPVTNTHNLRKRKSSSNRHGSESDRKPAALQSAKRPAVARKPPPTDTSAPSGPAPLPTRISNHKQPASSSKAQTSGKRPASSMVGCRRTNPSSWRRSRSGAGEDDRGSSTMWNDTGYRYSMNSTRRDEAEDPVASVAQRDCGDEELAGTSRRENELQFFMALKKKGLELREQEGDGNCLFRAVSLQVYGDSSMHGEVRRKCMDFMERDREHFAQFLAEEPFDQYIERKRQDGVHGNNPELQAISELFNRPVEVFCPENGATPLNIFQTEYKTNDVPIRLSYHDGNHYNAVVDPLVPTAGLGLGLPGLQPGLADKMQMAKAVAESDAAADQAQLKRAVKESEDDELQRAIKESSLSVEHMYNNQAMTLSDMDATYFELEQAALERSMQSFPSFEQGQKQKASSRRRRSDRSSPPHQPEISSESQGRDQPPASAAVASLPNSSGVPPAAAAAAASSTVASLASAARSPSPHYRDPSEYPSSVQELVMNGFELRKVVRAYELVGDNFDSILALLINGQ